MRNILPAALLLLLSVTIPAKENVYAPFASHLEVVANGREAILSWTDSPNAPDLLYYVLRSTAPIDSSTMAQSETLAVVAPGIVRYTDRPENDGPWWYAIATSGPEGIYDVMIPWRNTLVNPVRLEAAVIGSGDRAVVTGLDVRVAGRSMLLTFNSTVSDAGVVLLRSPVAFDDIRVIDYAVEIGRSGKASEILEDKPLPGVNWYYAAMDAGLFDEGSPDRLNQALSAGPFISAEGEDQSYTSAPMRSAPLPVLRIGTSMRDGSEIPAIDGILPDKESLDTVASDTILTLLGPSSAALWTEPEPVVMATETAVTEERRQSQLNSIISGSFAAGDWAAAEEELFALAASNGLDKSTRARIYFYMGQCRYYRNNNRAAFLSFLTASDEYYPECRKWIVRIYADLLPVG